MNLYNRISIFDDYIKKEAFRYFWIDFGSWSKIVINDKKYYNSCFALSVLIHELKPKSFVLKKNDEHFCDDNLFKKIADIGWNIDKKSGVLSVRDASIERILQLIDCVLKYNEIGFELVIFIDNGTFVTANLTCGDDLFIYGLRQNFSDCYVSNCMNILNDCVFWVGKVIDEKTKKRKKVYKFLQR